MLRKVNGKDNRGRRDRFPTRQVILRLSRLAVIHRAPIRADEDGCCRVRFARGRFVHHHAQPCRTRASGIFRRIDNSLSRTMCFNETKENTKEATPSSTNGNSLSSCIMDLLIFSGELLEDCSQPLELESQIQGSAQSESRDKEQTFSPVMLASAKSKLCL